MVAENKDVKVLPSEGRKPQPGKGLKSSFKDELTHRIFEYKVTTSAGLALST